MCGEVSVPEDRGIKGGRQIALSVVVLPGRSAAGRADPIFGIAGGPGIGSTRLAVSYPRLYDALQADHDIVLVDQRGTGDSHPLKCTVVAAPARVFDEMPDTRALAQCRDRLAKDADLKQYTTRSAVVDLEAVRQALGYGKINLLGISYGTRVALEYLRRYESNVRAIVVSGVLSPDFKAGVNAAQNAQQALRQLFGLCEGDAACRGAFPRLESKLDAVLGALDKGPAVASVPISETGPPLKVTISRTVFARELTQLLQNRESWTALPLAVHRAAAGDFVPFAGLVLAREAARNPLADGMALSVICSQDVPSFTPAAIAAGTRGTFLRDDRVKYLTRACATWPHAAPDPAAATPVRAATPALLISGALDPVTPSQHAAEVAKTLPNGVHVVVANVAHVPANPCVNGMIVAFMKAGSSRTLDTACAGNVPPLKFITSIPW